MKLPDIFKKLKRNNTGELVCQIPEAEVMDEETPCKQGVATTKKPFRFDGNNILFKELIWAETKGLSEEILKRMVNSLNKAYQTGFSEGATLMLNK